MNQLTSEILFNIVGDSYELHKLMQILFKKYYYYTKYHKEFLDEYFEQQVFIEDNNVVYKIRGVIGRKDDLPAIEYIDGTKCWYKDGKHHRDNDLPAIEYADGTKKWYKGGDLHRDNDLPAVECADGTKYWYKDGKHHRDNDLPAVEYMSGSKYWYKDGKRHRDNYLPAVEYMSGHREWYENGIFVKLIYAHSQSIYQ